MPDKLAFNISVANTSTVDVETVLNFLEENCDELLTYRKVVPPDVPRADAFRFLAVLLNAAGSVASLASLVWLAYEKFIGSTKVNDEDKAGFMISIAPANREKPMMFWVGGEYKSREEFIADFTRIASDLDANEAEYNRVVDKLMEDPEKWLPRTSHRNDG